MSLIIITTVHSMARLHLGLIKAENGFITLVTVIIISLVTLSVTFTNLLLSISALQTSNSNEQSHKALSIADACVYTALNQIRLNSSFTGSNVVSLGEGSCNYAVTDVAGVSGSTGGGNVVSLKMDDIAGSTSAADSSGNSRSFTCAGGQCPTFGVAGQCSTAAHYDGTNDYLSDAAAGSYINGLNAFSLSMWVKSDLTNTDRGFMIAYPPDTNDNVLGIRYDAGGLYGGGTNVIKAGVTVNTGAGVFVQQMESASGVQTTNWQHLVLTWKNGDDIQLYINGVLSTPTYRDPIRLGFIDGASTLFVGRGSKDAAPDNSGPWQGSIDNLDVWNRVLTTAEIQQLYTGCALNTDPRKEIDVTATVGSVTKKIKATTLQLNPVIKINSWEEIADF